MGKRVCPNCGYVGKPKKKTKGSFWIEVILWLMFIVPGILYSVWRISSREKVCPKCGNPHMIPLDSPRGRKVLEELGISSSKQNSPEAEEGGNWLNK